MNNSLQKYQSKIQPTISVLLQPCNENQELNYIENYKGTPDTIIQHCLEIIAGLQKTLRLGTFSVKSLFKFSRSQLFKHKANHC